MTTKHIPPNAPPVNADSDAGGASATLATDLDADLIVADSNQETDVWWGAYAGRTMAPTFALCTLLSVNISLLIGWVWSAERLSPQVMWHLAVLFIIVVWFFPVALCIYRTLSRNYRLTTRYLYRDSGFHRPAAGQVDLARVSQVRVTHAALERWMGIGRITIEIEEEKTFVLDGVLDPEPVAKLIRRRVERAKMDVLKSHPKPTSGA